MSAKELLINLVEEEQREEERIEKVLNAEELDATGTYEVWSAKDTIAHIAEWMLGEADKLAGLEAVTTFASNDEKNRELFKKHEDEDWTAIRRLSEEAAAQLISQIRKRSKEEIALPFGSSDTRNRPVWRRAIGYGVLHPVSHIGQIYIKRRDFAYAVALHEKFSKKMENMEGEDNWRGTLAYDLARVHALAGNALEAIEKLKVAVELDPSLVESSKKDPDLESLRSMDEYRSIYS